MRLDLATIVNWPWPMISAGLTVAVLCILFYINFVRPIRGRKRDAEKQEAVDELSELLSTAIRDLLNRPVHSEGDLNGWDTDFQSWCASTILKLRENFTKSERLHFDRLGTVPIQSFGRAWNERHNHLLNMLDIKFNRLRDIIRDNQRRD